MTRFHHLRRSHKTRMRRAELCVEVATHWSDILVTERFIRQAYSLCDGCGCPLDLWPVSVLKLHVGVS